MLQVNGLPSSETHPSGLPNRWRCIPKPQPKSHFNSSFAPDIAIDDIAFLQGSPDHRVILWHFNFICCFLNRRYTDLAFVKQSWRARGEAVRADTLRISLEIFPTMSSFISHPNSCKFGTREASLFCSTFNTSSFAWQIRWYLDFIPKPVKPYLCIARKAQAL